MSSVLYLSYDGMTDPLGESQVLPYVLGLAARGHRFHLLSFEKPERYARGRARIEGLLEGNGVVWHPETFTARPRLLAKAWDAWRLDRAVAALHRRHHFDLVHCRSYPAAAAGLRLRRRHGVPYLFDMRGFWVDERVEGGIWDLRNPVYRLLFRHFKRRERAYLDGASAVVSLTEAAVDTMRGWPGSPPPCPVEVIPCCVDTHLFSPRGEPEARARTRAELGVAADAFLVVYLGSIGTWYMLPEMLRWFRALLAHEPSARFLFVTRHDPDALARAAEAEGVDAGRLVVRPAVRPEVPGLLEAADLSVFFIRPTFSKTASCPTKLGELMAVGTPVVCNAGVGDVDDIVARYGAGVVLPDTEEPTLAEAARGARSVAALPPEPMVRGARAYFSLERGVERYARLYDLLTAGDADRSGGG